MTTFEDTIAKQMVYENGKWTYTFNDGHKLELKGTKTSNPVKLVKKSGEYKKVSDDVKAIKELRANLSAIINCIAQYIHLYGPASIDEIAMCTDEIELKIINIFGPNIVETLKMLKEIWKKDNREDLWADLNDTILSIVKSFEE